MNPNETLRVSDLPLVKKYLGVQCRIVVVNPRNLRKIYAGDAAPNIISLELYPDDYDSDTGHFNLITKLPAYFDGYYMCVDC